MKSTHAPKYAFFQASSALIDISAIEKEVLPVYFERVFKEALEQNTLRMPSDEEIENLTHIGNPPKLRVLLENLIFMQDESIECLCNLEDLNEKQTRDWEQTERAFTIEWRDKLNSGDYIPDDIVTALTDITEKGYKIKILNDFMGLGEKGYQKLFGAIPSLRFKGDFAQVSIRSIERKSPIDFFILNRHNTLPAPSPSHIMENKDIIIFTNNTGLLAQSFNAGSGIATCLHLPRIREVDLPHSVSHENFFTVHHAKDIVSIVERGLPQSNY